MHHSQLCKEARAFLILSNVQLHAWERLSGNVFDVKGVMAFSKNANIKYSSGMKPLPYDAYPKYIRTQKVYFPIRALCYSRKR